MFGRFDNYVGHLKPSRSAAEDEVWDAKKKSELTSAHVLRFWLGSQMLKNVAHQLRLPLYIHRSKKRLL
jgi:hypothetical protein